MAQTQRDMIRPVVSTPSTVSLLASIPYLLVMGKSTSQSSCLSARLVDLNPRDPIRI